MKNSKNANVRYIVNDVGQAISFYRDLLGFEVDMHPAPGFAALTRGALRLYLNQPGAGGAGQKMEDGAMPAPGGWNRMQIETDHLRRLYDELQQNGASFRSGIIEGQGGNQALLQDPSGNLIELFEPKAPENVDPVPEGFHTVTPFLIADDAAGLIAFIETAFSGEVVHMMKTDDGLVRHSTVRIGNSMVMIASATESFKSMPSMLHLYLPDVDAVYHRALTAGARSVREPEDQFYGDRSAGVDDAWGNQWWLATHIEEVSGEDMKKREAGFRKKAATK